MRRESRSKSPKSCKSIGNIEAYVIAFFQTPNPFHVHSHVSLRLSADFPAFKPLPMDSGYIAIIVLAIALLLCISAVRHAFRSI